MQLQHISAAKQCVHNHFEQHFLFIKSGHSSALSCEQSRVLFNFVENLFLFRPLVHCTAMGDLLKVCNWIY